MRYHGDALLAPLLNEVHFRQGAFIDQEQKLEDQRQSDTVPVIIISHADTRLEVVIYSAPSAHYAKSMSLHFRESIVAIHLLRREGG